MEAFARGEDDQLQAGEAAATERMQELLKQAAKSGLLDKLPAGLQQRLGADTGSDGEGLSLEGLDAETLKQLAAAMSQTAGDALEGLDAGELLQDLELSDLTELLEGELCKLCEGEAAEDCPG